MCGAWLLCIYSYNTEIQHNKIEDPEISLLQWQNKLNIVLLLYITNNTTVIRHRNLTKKSFFYIEKESISIKFMSNFRTTYIRCVMCNKM